MTRYRFGAEVVKAKPARYLKAFHLPLEYGSRWKAFDLVLRETGLPVVRNPKDATRSKKKRDKKR